ncbi:hypothetical protein BBJ28_00010388 [Nothophytophthora sp. Chile5]|nr:hypothetical protein BBJ28_00010388 [Nothophytophthora sp. Chile5]
MSGRIRVLCERIMSRGYEPRVARLMENVKATVRAQPGLLSVETFAQVDDHTKYVVFSEVGGSCPRLLLLFDFSALPAPSKLSACCCEVLTNHGAPLCIALRALCLQWQSKKDFDRWVTSKEFQECTEQINELLDVPGLHTRIFKTPKDDVFLL